MLTHLNRIKLALLITLGALCILQWVGEKAARNKILELQRRAHEQAHKLAEQEDSLRGVTEDLEHFRSQVSSFKVQIDDQNGKIRQQKARSSSWSRRSPS